MRVRRLYERRAFNMFRAYFKNEARKVPYLFLNQDNFIDSIDTSIKIGGLYNTYHDVYKVIGLLHGSRIGRSINRDLKRFNGVQFESEYGRGLYDWVLQNVGHRIVTVRREYVGHIQKLVAEGFRQGYSTRDLAQYIEALVNRRDFYNWQALRIARTETTAAANQAAVWAGDSSGVALDKVWISAADERTRRYPDDKFDHWVMNDVQVGQHEYFNVQGELVEFPGALFQQTGELSSAGNVINCRCTVALIPRRDADGRLVRNRGGRRPVRRVRQVQPRVVEQVRDREVTEFVPAKSIKEANEFALKELNMQFADFKGLDLKVANEVNELYFKLKRVMPNVQTNGIGSAQAAQRAMRRELVDFYKTSERYKWTRDNVSLRAADSAARRYANRYSHRVPSGVVAWSANYKQASLYTRENGEQVRKILNLEKYSGLYVSNKYGKYDVINDVVKRNEATGWFFKKAKGARAILAHELGHEIDKTIGFRSLKSFREIYEREHAKGIDHVINNLSKYGATAGGKSSHKPFEMIAEAWAEFMTVSNPRPLAKEIGELMLKEYYNHFKIAQTGTNYTNWVSQILKIMQQ